MKKLTIKEEEAMKILGKLKKDSLKI